MLVRAGRMSSSRHYALSNGSMRLLNGESGFGIDFADMTMSVKDVVTPANNFSGDPNSKITYVGGTKYVLGSNGLYTSGTTLRTSYDASGNALGCLIEEGRTNLFLNSRSPATQSITTAATSYTISGVGAVGATLTLSGTATGVLTGTAAKDRDKLTFTATAGTLTITVAGTWDFVNVEAGTFATSPIVTAGTSVARAADKLSLLTSAFQYSATTGTVFFEYGGLLGGAMFRRLWQLNLSDASGYIDRFIDGAGNVYQSIMAGGLIKSGVAATGRSALAYAANDVAVSENGAAVVVSGTYTTASQNRLQIGNSSGSSQYLNGYVKRLAYFPRRRPNAELQAF